MKKVVIAGLVIVVVVSWAGLSIFDTGLWAALAVMAALEVALAVALFTSRWRNRWAALVVAVLAIFQIGQSYFYEQVRYTSSDPVIPIDNFGVLVLCVLAISLIAAGPAWPADHGIR